MEILLRAVEIVDANSSWHRKKADILINNGFIIRIAERLEPADEEIRSEGLMVSPGWLDMRAHFADPGHEHKETLASGASAAMKGGFTEVCLLPNTNPVVASKNDISYIKKAFTDTPVKLHPYGAITKNTAGEEFTEMLDMYHAGAVGFTDGLQPLWNTDILLKTLQYLQKINTILINKPEDKWLSLFGQMHEGTSSTLLGMKGIPALAEEIIVQRDLDLLRYAGGKLHFATVSTAKGLELIKKAKEEGLNVTCDVASYQLDFTDADLLDYDTNKKVSPPLRSAIDASSLKEAIFSGVIDAVVSNHIPQDEENKKSEFDLAADGMINLQTLFPVLMKHIGVKDLDRAIHSITTGPRDILGLPHPTIAEGQPANLTLFNPTVTWVFTKEENASNSINSPYFGQTMEGRALGVIRDQFIYFHPEVAN